MQKAKKFISTLYYNKFFWQLILAIFMIGMAAFFISHEHLEVLQIKEQLSNSHPGYVMLGIALTLIYILLQGQMYVHSFRAIGKGVPIGASTRLFLKRNLVSVLLPAGGFSSLAFFTREMEEKAVTKSQIHLASTIFGFISILSVVVVGVPVLAFALLFYDVGKAELWGFAFLIFLTLAFVFLLYSVSKKGIAYQWLSRIRPAFAITLDDMVANKIERAQLWKILMASVVIEFLGIVHLYIAMLALNFEPSLPAAIIGYIVMVILLIASPFLRGFGAIEVSLTYLLGQFGFPIVAAATITLLYRFFEFWLPLLAGLFSFINRKDNLVLRIFPACIIAVLGIVNIVSAVTPAIPSRMRLLKDLIPADLIATSNSMVLVFGLLMVILSVFLLQGSRRAWLVALLLTSCSLVGHLFKGVDYEEATMAFAAIGALMFTRDSYKLKPHPKFTGISYWVLLYSVAALFVFGIASFYLIDKRHFGVDFNLWRATKTVFHMFFLFDEGGVAPKTAFAQNFIYAVYTAGGLVLVFIFSILLMPYFSKPYNSEADRELAKKILEKYGNSTLDYFKIYPDKLLFIATDRDGFLAFKLTRHFGIVLENPVCRDVAAMEKIILEFDLFCEENGFISAYYRVPAATLEVYKRLGKKSLPIGEEAIVDLTKFTLEGGKMKSTRSAINRLTAEGFDIRAYTPPIKLGLLQKLEQVSDEWLEDLQQKEIAFTQGVFDTEILKNQPIITLEDREEKVYAFLNIVPDYRPGETTYDLVRKSTDAPNGVLDMLLTKTLLYLKEQGYTACNIGLAPLSGVEGVNLAERSIRYAFENLKPFARFKGLRKYKDKFFPRWDAKYLVYSHNYHLLQIPRALKRVSEGE